MSILTCRMGLYLYSRPINPFFKRSIRLRWSKRFDQWIFHFFLLGIDSQQFFHFSYKHIKKKKKIFGSSLIIWFGDSISVRIRIYRFILHPSWSFDGRIPLLTHRSQLHLLEQLPLSLCTYPFLLSLSEYLSVFRKQDLAQDCPFVIPGFLWIWKLSLGRFPYQGSIQLSP